MKLSYLLKIGAVCLLPATGLAQGVLFRGVGAINEGMGGAGIAAPIDSAGAVYGNPAALTGLVDNEVAVSMGFLLPDSSVASQIKSMPATYAKESTQGKVHFCPIVSGAYRMKKESPLTFGIMVGGVGGASVNYHAADPSYTNPILQGRHRKAEVVVMQALPTVSYAVNDNLSLGLSVASGIFSIKVDPMPFGQSPSSPLLDSDTAYTYGIGVNFGAYYDFKNHFKVGFLLKSPMWADSFKFAGADPVTGAHTRETFNFNLPMVVGGGVSYDGFKNWLLAFDIRYFDYHNTRGFKSVEDQNGNIAGLGWDSICSFTFGAQYDVTKDLKVRAGYCFNENPIPGKVQYANVASPMFIQHVVTIGATYALPQNFDVSLAWAHAFKNSVSGDFANGAGRVTNTVNADTVFVSITKRF